MRLPHGSHVAALFAALLLILPAAAARRPAPEKPRRPRIVSTFLCTDEYVYRLVPRDRIAARLVSARLQSPRPPVRTLIYEPNGYATASGVSDEILAAAGLRNVAESLHTTRSGTLPVEAVLAARPELLILNSESESQPARANLVQRHPALSALNGHSDIVRMPLTPLLCP